MTDNREAVLELQLQKLCMLVEQTGTQLRNHAAVLSEFGGDLDDLRMIIRGHAKIGEAMDRAVKRTREVVWPDE